MKNKNCRWSLEVEEVIICNCPSSLFKDELLEDDDKCNNCDDFYSQIESENQASNDEYTEGFEL